MKHYRLILTYLFIVFAGLINYTCSENKQQSSPDIIIRISVKNEITVNRDTVSIDSLELKLEEIGATNQTNIKIVPDPEAGAATVEQVQRRVGVFKGSK